MQPSNTNERYTSDFTSMINIVRLNSLGFFFIGFLIPVVARSNMSASATEIGFVVSFIVLGHMISDPFIGYLTDHLHSKRTLIFIGAIGRGISYFIIYFAFIVNSLLFLGIGTLTLGLMVGFFWVPFDALIAEKSNKNNRSHAYGKREAANALGQVIGATIGLTILSVTGYFTNNPFFLYLAIPIYGIANFIGGILFLVKVDEKIKFYKEPTLSNDFINEKIINEPKKKAFPRAMLFGLSLLLLVVLLSSINGNIAKPFLNIYVLENITSDLILVFLAYLPSGLLATLLAPKLGYLIDKVNPRLTITLSALIGAIITWLVINTTNIWFFIILIFADYTIALSGGLIFKNLTSRVNVEHRGKILGFSSFFMNLGATVGPIMGGIVWDAFGPKSPFIVSIFVELSLIPLYWLITYYLLPHLAESYDRIEKE